MDNQRPELDLKFFRVICPDQNVPVIVVFTKYEQFLYNVKMDLSDYPDNADSDISISEVAEKLFQEHYLHPLGDDARYVRLQKMHKKDSHCSGLIEKTAASLNEDIVALMLLAVQRGNIELSVKTALMLCHDRDVHLTWVTEFGLWAGRGMSVDLTLHICVPVLAKG